MASADNGNDPDDESVTPISAQSDDAVQSVPPASASGEDDDDWDDSEDEGWDLVDRNTGSEKPTDRQYAADLTPLIDSAPEAHAVMSAASKRNAFADEVDDVEDDSDNFIDEFEDKDMPLADELGIEDLTDILFADRGRILSAAGRDAPVAEFEDNGVILRPPQKPWLDSGFAEEVIYHSDEHGILLNELGERRKIVGAKYKGMPVYVIAEQKPGTVKHYAAWFDPGMRAHKFYVQGDALTSDMVFRIRNRTHDGEISVFPEIQTE